MKLVILLVCIAMSLWTTGVVFANTLSERPLAAGGGAPERTNRNLDACGSSDRWRITDPPAQKYMLELARRAFDTYAKSRTVIDAPSSLPAFLKQRSGVFVSTMRYGAPRTCVGTLYPMQPNLADEIIESAVESAGRDRRFAPVRVTELPLLNLIVSIVDTPRPISAGEAAELDPSVDGLAAKCGDRFGVVLSGETPDPANLPKWGRIRAGAKATDAVEYFEVHDVRFMESQFK